MEKIILYFSAFVPMYFLLAIKLVIDILFGNLSFNILNSISLALFVFLTLVGMLGIIRSFNRIECDAKQIEIIKCNNSTDAQFFNYFSLFVLFSLTYQIEYVSMFCVFLTILTFIGLVYIRNNLFNINPLLNILGYSYYEIVFRKVGEKEQQTAKVFHKGKLQLHEYRYCYNENIKNFIIIK